MTLLDILISVSIIAMVASFWRVRDYAELARQTALQYCNRHQLVFVSVARRQIHWSEGANHRRFQFDYSMEFSTANDVLYEGTISIYKSKIKAIDVPAYRIPE